ncbi:hypothetical protein DRQ26_06480 [bacterium]|nr:MAG: hypothetical protein DRQ26_06480 [bacterium]
MGCQTGSRAVGNAEKKLKTGILRANFGIFLWRTFDIGSGVRVIRLGCVVRARWVRKSGKKSGRKCASFCQNGRKNAFFVGKCTKNCVFLYPTILVGAGRRRYPSGDTVFQFVQPLSGSQKGVKGS